MKKVRQYTVYDWADLPAKSKELALRHYRDFNTEHDWWDFIYEDAMTVGLQLQGFDLYPRTIDGKLVMEMSEAIKAIMANHGPETKTYELARNYKPFCDAIIGQDEVDEEALEELADEFADRLARAYLDILQKEYEYLTSDEAVAESLEANGYFFTKQGRIA